MRNNIAHLLVPTTPTEVDQNGGAPATSGGAKHGNDDDGFLLRCSPDKWVPEQLGTTRSVPEGCGETEEDGGALAAEMLAGSEDEGVGTAT